MLTNVDEVALAVQHDVAVVSVFYLQQEEQQAVRCHTADEVVPRLKREVLEGISDQRKYSMTDDVKACTRM